MDPKKYIGSDEVVSVTVLPLKTFKDNEVASILYASGRNEVMPMKTYLLLATDAPSDATTIRNTKFLAMMKEVYPVIGALVASFAQDTEERKESRRMYLGEILSILGEYDIKMSEVESIVNVIQAELVGIPMSMNYDIDNAFNRATNYLWTKDDSKFIPGVNMMSDRTFLETKSVLESMPKTDEVQQ